MSMKSRRRGLTILEMMVATSVTLLIVFGMVEMFRILGAQASEGRALLDLSGQLRGTTFRLQRDLEGITVPVRPWPSAESAPGYFEIYEGISNDTVPVPGMRTPSMYGDIDDVIMFTARSIDEPFLGRAIPNPEFFVDGSGVIVQDEAGKPIPRPAIPIKSKLAEIVWWTKPEFGIANPTTGEREILSVSLHRRALLILPDLGVVRNWGPGIVNNPIALKAELLHYFANNDVSVRIEPYFVNNNQIWVRLVANSLEDLTKRENRFGHYSLMSEMPQLAGNPIIQNGRALFSKYPYPLQLNPLAPTLLNPDLRRSVTSLQQLVQSERTTDLNVYNYLLQTNRHTTSQDGEDVVAHRVLGFDIRVFDPTAPIFRDILDNSTMYKPGDPGWYRLVTSADPLNEVIVVGAGAYVDLFYDRDPNGPFANTNNTNREGWLGRVGLPPSSMFSRAPNFKSGFFMGPFASNPQGNRLVNAWVVASMPTNRPVASEPGMQACYCTWTKQYENDGLDQTRRNPYRVGSLPYHTILDNVNFFAEANSPVHLRSGLPFANSVDNDGDNIFDEGIDEGVNNLDDDGLLGADDMNERETSPPYPHPLRGIRINIRVWDPDSRQVRQVSVSSNFTPE